MLVMLTAILLAAAVFAVLAFVAINRHREGQ